MNGIFKSKEAETDKSLVEIINVAETDCKLGSNIPRNDVSDIINFCPKRIRHIKETTDGLGWSSLINLAVLQIYRPCSRFALERRVQTQKKEHELIGLPNLYCLRTQ